jgi:pyrroloquinoline quinone biosynthesis protein D
MFSRDGLRPALCAWSHKLPPPVPTSQPRLSPGCRWGTRDEHPVILFPEGMIRVRGTGQKILELCDGRRTLQEIVTTLSESYISTDAKKITEDVMTFLETLQQKRIIDY